MNATVITYMTRGIKYHLSGECPRMINGESLWDGDGEDDFHFAGAYRHEGASPALAAARGKLPCLYCVPEDQRVFPPLYGQTFGHVPVTGISLFDCAGQVCARCTEDVWFGDEPHLQPMRVEWPCTSAVVLGLAQREEVQK